MKQTQPPGQTTGNTLSLAHLRTSEQPAGLVWRLSARIVDSVIFTWVVFFVMVEIDQRLLGGDPLAQRQARLVFDSTRSIVLVLVLVALYEIVPAVLYGATPGKALLGLRVRMATRSMSALAAAFGRAVVVYLPILFLGAFGLVVAVVLLLSVVLAGDGRGLHDRLLGTLVVSLPHAADTD